MKSGLPWNLSGVDKETREAVIEAAKLSGLTVGEWLNQVLGENFAEPELDAPAQSEDDAAAVAQAIERLTRKLGGMDDGARAGIVGLPDRLDQIEHHISRLSNMRKDGTERSRSLKGISAMVKELARDADNADERARSMIEGLRARSAPPKPNVNEAINDLDARIAEMRNRMAPQPEPVESRPMKLDEIRARLDTLLADAPAAKTQAPPQTAMIDAALRALEDRIDDAKARFEAKMAARLAEPPPPPPGPPPATAEQIERVEQRLADIAMQLAESEAERKRPKKEAELASAIREISSHQRAIDDRAETLAMRRDQKALSAAMAALRADLGGLTEQVSAISRVGEEQHGAFFQVAQRIDSMAAEQPMDRTLLAAIRSDLETMREMVEGTARQSAIHAVDARHDSFEAQINDVLRNMPDRAKLDELGEEVAALRQSLESDDSPRAIQRLEMKMSELGRSIEATLTMRQMPHEDAAVERLESRMQDIAARLEGLRDTGAHTAAIHTVEQRLDGRLNEIADRLGGFMNITPQAIENTSQRLEGRLEEIASRVNGFMVTTPRVIEDNSQRLEGRLEEIASQLNGMMATTPRAIEDTSQRLEGRLEEIAERLGGMVTSAVQPQTAAIESAQRQLEGRLEEIVSRLGGMFDTAPQRAAIEHVHERLSAITDRIDTLNASQREPSAALDAIKSEIGALRKDVAEKELPQLPTTDHLERQIRDLGKQLETVAQGKNEAKALAELESQVARLATELELTKPSVAALGQVEGRLDRLQLLLADTAQESMASARAEARKAVDELSEMVAGNEIDADLVRGLMRDLDSLRAVTGGSNEETRSKLESVSQTVSQVVDRLSRLETEAATVIAKATGTHGSEPARPQRREASNLAWTAAFRGEKAEAPAATTKTTLMPKPPAEALKQPVAEALKAALAPAPAPEVVAVPQADKKAADRRADFIAAARRAAQAVADEAAAIETAPAQSPADTMDAADRRPGAFSRISQAIRNRKRPLLLAAAAIVLAIGAMQAYGKFTVPSHSSPLVAEVPETAPVTALPKPPRDIIAEAAASTPGLIVAQPAMIAPPAVPDSSLAFAAPDKIQDRFIQAPAQAVATDRFNGSPEDAATVAVTAEAQPDAAEPVMQADGPAADANPIVLASAGEAPALPAVNTSGLNSRLGSPKLLNAAGEGDPAAAFEIATRYADGSLVKKDLSQAAVWYTKAAEGGVAVAQYRLGSLYERGQGVTKDLTKAVDWYQRAADQGNVNAMHNLAVLMSEGADTGPDHDKALQWFLAAGNYGVRDSQYNLGVIYARGLGVAQDLPESYKWFAIAASQGDTDASARRDEVAKALSADDLAKARATVAAWHVKAPIAEANGVAAPSGGWDGPGDTIGDADRQALVQKIQTLLAEAGYDPGPADGVAGPKTVDAVKQYQEKTGQPVTGQIDKTLMASLAQ